MKKTKTKNMVTMMTKYWCDAKMLHIAKVFEAAEAGMCITSYTNNIYNKNYFYPKWASRLHCPVTYPSIDWWQEWSVKLLVSMLKLKTDLKWDISKMTKFNSIQEWIFNFEYGGHARYGYGILTMDRHGMLQRLWVF